VGKSILPVSLHRPAHRPANSDIVVRSLNRKATHGWLTLGALRFPCALGRSGRLYRKAEGDGGTPIGIWQLRQVHYRADFRPTDQLPWRLARPRIGWPGLWVRAIRPGDGWCDARGDRNYNRAVKRPYPASSETLWRDDRLYDLVVVLDYNERPRIQGCGSAIFMHVARPGFTPTEGCVALQADHLRRVLAALRHGSRLRIT
jgi:L,D-peptidoglycan transpeptidase YkuD (ErfK/YbiS/YcfS/YnhG family)